MTASFEQQMMRMNGLRFVPADLTTHWEALQDVPYDLLVGAVSHAQRVCVDFPTPHDLRTYADIVKPHVAPVAPAEDRGRKLATPRVIQFPQGGLTINVTHEWTYYCELCSDEGWESLWCGDPANPARQPWLELFDCERSHRHQPHEWARQCRCYATNHAIQARLERQRKYAADRGKK